jgi:O-antigen ligase
MACQYAIYAFEPNWGLTVARYISINYPLPRVEATSSLGPKFAPVFAAFAHPNFFGAYLLLFWFIIFLPNKPAKRPMASLILKMGMIAALITTRSKGATIGIGGALFLVLFFWFIARGRFQIAAFVAIAIITTALVYFTYLLYERDTSVQIRLHVTQIALKSVAEKPLLGYGPGSFSSAFKDLETRQFKRDNGPTSRVSSAESSHNSYVRLLVENGLLGLFALFGLLSALIRHGLKGLGLSRFSNPPPHIGLTLGILAFAIQAATDDTFAMSKLTFMFWILVALILHLTPQNQVDQYSDPASEFDETLPETAEV